MADFTKGPWGVRGGSEVWIMAGPLHVATIPRAYDADWSRSNADLIAAAPEMYEALHEAQLTTRELCEGQPPENECWAVLSRINAAIAKAEGKT